MDADKPSSAEGHGPSDRLADLYGRPGFLIRRAHQITTALFAEEAEPLGVTSTQFGLLVVLAARAPIDQIGVARLMGLDRSTTGMVLNTLETRGLIERVTDPRDRRRRVLNITPAGLERLRELEGPTRRAQQRALDVFSSDEAARFLALLKTFVAALNDDSRTPPFSPDAD